MKERAGWPKRRNCPRKLLAFVAWAEGALVVRCTSPPQPRRQKPPLRLRCVFSVFLFVFIKLPLVAFVSLLNFSCLLLCGRVFCVFFFCVFRSVFFI